jgi:regulator of cell morphogenesis and NO signaling
MESHLSNIQRLAGDGITAYFGKDHDRLSVLFEKFQSLKRTDFQRAKYYFTEFKSGLNRHILWEEEILFPLFEQKMGIGNAGPTFEIKKEHKQIYKILEDINEKVEKLNPDTDKEEENFIKILFFHKIKEENVLYMPLDDCTSSDEKDQVFMMMSILSEERYERIVQ